MYISVLQWVTQLQSSSTNQLKWTQSPGHLELEDQMVGQNHKIHFIVEHIGKQKNQS